MSCHPSARCRICLIDDIRLLVSVFQGLVTLVDPTPTPFLAPALMLKKFPGILDNVGSPDYTLFYQCKRVVDEVPLQQRFIMPHQPDHTVNVHEFLQLKKYVVLSRQYRHTNAYPFWSPVVLGSSAVHIQFQL